MDEKKNTLGIVGISLGSFIPFVGVVLGILSLVKKEKSVAIGIISILVGVFGWIVVLSLLFIFLGFMSAMV